MFCCLKRESQIFFPGEISVISNRKNLFPQTTKNCQSTKFSWSRTVDFSRLCILFFTLNQRNVLNRTEDIFFSVLSVTLHKAVRKNFTMDSGRRSPLKKKLFLAEKSNKLKCDQCITKIFTENLVYEERVFYRLNQWIGRNWTEPKTSFDSKHFTMDSRRRAS